jgi:hypothetical protein
LTLAVASQNVIIITCSTELTVSITHNICQKGPSCGFSTFDFSLPCGRRFLNHHHQPWIMRQTGHQWTSTGHQKDTMDTKWICFLAGHGVYAFASQPFAT